MSGARHRRLPGVFAFHSANGGFRKPVEAAIMKGLGVTAGVPDVIAICHRDAPVRCAGCGREVARRARRQLFCSQRCRQRAHRTGKPIKIAPRYHPSGGATNPLEKDSKYNALQWAKTLSSHRVLAPAHVLACEVFGGHGWRHATSTGGVAVEVGHLRSRALVERSGGAS